MSSSANNVVTPICLQVSIVNYDYTQNTVNPVNGNTQLTFGISLLIAQGYGYRQIYDLTSILPGMWIGGSKSGLAWRITGVDPGGAQATDSNGNLYLQYINIYVEDVSNYNTILWGQGYATTIPADTSQSIVFLVFELNSSGLPAFNGLYSQYQDPANLAQIQQLPIDLLSRFNVTSPNTQYINVIPSYSVTLAVGDPIWWNPTINNGAGGYDRPTGANTVYTLGIVSNITTNNTTGFLNFTFKVFGTYYNNVPNFFSETVNNVSFTLSSIPSIVVGSLVYIDSTAGYTLTAPTSGMATPLWIYLGPDSITGADTGILLPFGTSSGSGGGSGSSLPAGGAAGSILTKNSADDYDTYWNSPVYSSDNWLYTNIVGPPPAIVFGNVSTTTAAIYIPWTYPSQIPIGLISLYVPVINTLNVNYKADIGISEPVLTSYSTLVNVSTSYLDYHNGTSYVTGIILSKLSGTSRISSIIFPGDSVARNAYINYNTVLANISSSVNNTVTVWYANTNPNTNKSTVNFPVFLASGSPSAPRNLTLTSISSTSQTVNWTNPLSNDINDVNTQLTISSYTVAYGTTGSVLRYGGPISSLGNTSSVSGVVTTFAATSLFPDSVYTFGVQATNTGFQTGVSSYVSSITSALNPVVPAISGTIPLASRYFNNGTVKNILSNTSTLNLINISTPWTATVTVPIQTLANRASVAAGLMSLSTVYTNNTTSTIGPTLTYGGFGSSAPVTVTQSNITLSSLTITDSYGPNSHQGFYQQASTSITLNTGIFVPSRYDYTVNLKQYQAGINTGSGTFTFQYDTLVTSAPRIIGVSMNFSTSGVYWSSVTGVKVIFGQPLFTVSTIASTMGNYYYSDPLLTYTGGVGTYIPSSESGLGNVTAGLSAGAFTTGVITVTNRNIKSATLSTTYTQLLSTSVKANNIFSTSIVSSSRIAVMVDGPSFNLVYNTLPQSIPSVAGTDVIGYRVISGTAAANGVPPFTSSGSTYASVGYDNTLDISTLEELQVANGTFTTPNAQTYAYSDYRSLYYDSTQLNTANYSGILSSGYRYVTFAWKIAAGTYNTNIIFKINGISSTLPADLRLFYRVEDASSPNPTNSASFTSSWVNGATNSGSVLQSGNYFYPLSYSSILNVGLASGSAVINGSVATFTETITRGMGIISAQTINLYCRIGLPMNSAFSFTTVSASIS
jgi:hypothetical protein